MRPDAPREGSAGGWTNGTAYSHPGVLHIINGVMLLVFGFIAVALLGFLGLVASSTGHSAYIGLREVHITMQGIFGLMATMIAVIALIGGLPRIIGGWGLLAKQHWARIVVLIVGILNLLHFPLGTALGIYTLWVLLQPESPTTTAA
jgi:hypothetical protein